MSSSAAPRRPRPFHEQVRQQIGTAFDSAIGNKAAQKTPIGAATQVVVGALPVEWQVTLKLLGSVVRRNPEALVHNVADALPMVSEAGRAVLRDAQRERQPISQIVFERAKQAGRHIASAETGHKLARLTRDAAKAALYAGVGHVERHVEVAGEQVIECESHPNFAQARNAMAQALGILGRDGKINTTHWHSEIEQRGKDPVIVRYAVLEDGATLGFRLVPPTTYSKETGLGTYRIVSWRSDTNPPMLRTDTFPVTEKDVQAYTRSYVPKSPFRPR